MRGIAVLGIILIVIGVVSLVSQGITYKQEKHVVDFGPLEAHVKETKSVPLPPAVGVAALVGGVVLVAFGVRRP